MKTIIFHCNGSWKYTVISRVKSSEISVFRWDLASTSEMTHGVVVWVT